MYRITKKVGFEAAHFLENHPGRCASLHGHSYKLEVTVAYMGVLHKDRDMVMDFSLLKNYVELVTDHYDHAFIFDCTSDNKISKDFSNLCRRYGMRNVLLSGRPTAENMVRHIASDLIEALPEEIILERVKLWETETSYAEWGNDKNV